MLPPFRGNAVDAALATLFCNGLLTMQSMGLGGGFVANVYIAKHRRAYALNARERAPASVDVSGNVAGTAAEATAPGTPTHPRGMGQRGVQTEAPPTDFFDPLSSKYGTGAVAVPGEALGYWALHRRFGTVAWSKLWAPTVALCRRGFVLTRHMVDYVRPTFRGDEHLRLVSLFVIQSTSGRTI